MSVSRDDVVVPGLVFQLKQWLKYGGIRARLG